MPAAVAQPAPITEDDVRDPISFELFIDPIKTNCGHVYELLSITNSLQNSKNCPTCNKKVKDVTFDFQTTSYIAFLEIPKFSLAKCLNITLIHVLNGSYEG